MFRTSVKGFAYLYLAPRAHDCIWVLWLQHIVLGRKSSVILLSYQNSRLMLSKKAQYALKAAGYLATRYEKGPVQIQEISERKKIPLKFLENILLILKKEGIFDAKKGKGGGYFLIKPPEEVSVASIIRIVDGPISMLPCVSLYFYKKCEDCNEVECNINRVFTDVRDATLRVLEYRTLKDIM